MFSKLTMSGEPLPTPAQQLSTREELTRRHCLLIRLGGLLLGGQAGVEKLANSLWTRQRRRPQPNSRRIAVRNFTPAVTTMAETTDLTRGVLLYRAIIQMPVFQQPLLDDALQKISHGTVFSFGDPFESDLHIGIEADACGNGAQPDYH